MSYFTAYLDDSGTDPKQRVAIATALIIPAVRIPALDSEWKALQRKHGFTDFHTAEFAARNSKSEFANWSDDKQRAVLRRIRQIIRKYGAKIYSFTVNKCDYDEVVPNDLKHYIGSHYSWAIRHVISHCVAWRVSRKVSYPLQYLFDWMERNDPGRREIETIMEQAERQAKKMSPPLDGEYTNYDFRPRKDHPGLQCVDSLAWMLYQIGLDAFHGKPSHPLAHESWAEYASTLNGDTANLFEWFTAMSITRADLQQWIDQERMTNKAKTIFIEWEKEKNEQKASDEQSGVRKVRRGNARANKGAIRGHQSQAGGGKSGEAKEKAEG